MRAAYHLWLQNQQLSFVEAWEKKSKFPLDDLKNQKSISLSSSSSLQSQSPHPLRPVPFTFFRLECQISRNETGPLLLPFLFFQRRRTFFYILIFCCLDREKGFCQPRCGGCSVTERPPIFLFLFQLGNVSKILYLHGSECCLVVVTWFPRKKI